MDISSKYKQCKFCGVPLPLSYESEFCPGCEKNHLFWDVKEYIRTNIVNEFQVAEHFHIPVRMVKEWIREGRIEYREDPNEKLTIAGLHCVRCGAPVTFGTLCTKCLKFVNSNVHGYDTLKVKDDSRMRFLDSDNEFTDK